MRSTAPIHNSRSGLTGFLIRIGMSTPFNASAISCIEKGFAAVRAPIQRISTPYLSASNTWYWLATSVETYMPVSSFTRFNQGSPILPTPSNPPGLVRGFHIPARNILIPCAASSLAVSSTWSSVSALHGPAMTSGRLFSIPGRVIGSRFIIVSAIE